ncbi:Aste57867_18539 [Aphanomyces stellatus]|uniref:Aste57867_18539 protein n=1 Tax=Aphanomyces stellatus TaxID=120398 RepID=A0A485LBU9_9STRA|nr:hypothetical protein As57867_018477 [Aphanomyces stellatus]VFT95275.1 Aste57867_18539 [Aphanomyces stellatus]
MGSPSLLLVLLSSDLFARVASFQDGIYMDMRPFLTHVIPRRSDTTPNSLTRNDFDRVMAETLDPLLSTWLPTYGLNRLSKLFACLPFLRSSVLEYAVWSSNIAVLKWFDHQVGFASLHGHALVDIAVERRDVGILKLLFLHGYHEPIELETLKVAIKLPENQCMARFLVERCNDTLSPDAILQLLEVAITAGAIEIVDYLVDDVIASPNIVQHAWCVGLAAREGHFDLTLALLERGFDASKLSIDVAAHSGSLKLVQHLHDLGGYTCTTQAMDAASFQRGHLDLVQWLHENRREGCTSNAIWHAVCRGNLDLVQFLHANYPDRVDQDHLTPVVDAVAAAGHHWPLVQYMIEHKMCHVPDNIFDSAVASGQLEVVQWLLDNQTTLEVKWTTDAMDKAAGNGHLEMLQWLHDNHPTVTCTTDAWKNVVAKGNYHVVDWLITHGHCNEATARHVLDTIFQHGCVTTLESLLKKYGWILKWDATAALKTASLFRQLKMVRWLLRHRSHACAPCALRWCEQQGQDDLIAFVLRRKAQTVKGQCQCAKRA